MSVAPKLQEFLNQLAAIKPALIAMGFKRTQTGERENFTTVQRKFVTDIDYTTVVAVDDIIYNGKYPVAIRIYRPHLDVALPVAIFIHGGGHTCGSISQYDGVARKLAKAIQHIIVSIDYRLSPEFAYPTGLNDCRMVVSGIFAVLDERKINYSHKKLSIIGDSAGGALCASMVMDQEFVKTMQITNQVLIYPSLDYSMSSPSITKYAVGYALESERIRWYYDNYCQNNEDRKAISPLFGQFYTDMPATLIISAGFDPLCDESELYYQKILHVKGKAKHIRQENMIHAFLSLEDLCRDTCDETYEEINAFLIKK